MKIRLATRSDALAIVSVLLLSFLEYEESYTEEAFAATCPSSIEVEHRLAEGPIWIAVAEGGVVGTVSGVPDGKALLVRSLAVLPEYRGQGTGELLLHYAENYACENGFTRLILSTTPFLTPAIALYERFGFQRSSEGPSDRLGTQIFTMVKELKSG